MFGANFIIILFTIMFVKDACEMKKLSQG